MTPRQPSLGEIADDIAEIKNLLNQSYVRKDLYEAKHDALNRRVDSAIKNIADDVADINRRMSWVARAAVASLLFPILTGVTVAIIVAIVVTR